MGVEAASATLHLPDRQRRIGVVAPDGDSCVERTASTSEPTQEMRWRGRRRRWRGRMTLPTRSRGFAQLHLAHKTGITRYRPVVRARSPDSAGSGAPNYASYCGHRKENGHPISQPTAAGSHGASKPRGTPRQTRRSGLEINFTNCSATQ